MIGVFTAFVQQNGKLSGSLLELNDEFKTEQAHAACHVVRETSKALHAPMHVYALDVQTKHVLMHKVFHRGQQQH